MYKIITDSASNLTEDIIKKYNIEIISYTYTVDNEAHKCFEEGVDDEIEGRLYYERMRAGADVKTSLLSPADIEEVFEKYMKEGYDILFITISSKLSGTYQSGLIASELMKEMYAERKCIVVDSMSASLGEGFLAIKASELRDEGCTIDEAAQWIYDNRLRMRHIFTVDDLKYLKKGGRISSSVSLVGTVLNVKPILIATDEGAIGFSSLVRGRKKSLDALVKNYFDYAVDPSENIFGIAHCDCPEDAEYIVSKIKKVCTPKEIINCYYDRCTGGHVGPGALCIFYMGNNRSMDNKDKVRI